MRWPVPRRMQRTLDARRRKDGQGKGLGAGAVLGQWAGKLRFKFARLGGEPPSQATTVTSTSSSKSSTTTTTIITSSSLLSLPTIIAIILTLIGHL